MTWTPCAVARDDRVAVINREPGLCLDPASTPPDNEARLVSALYEDGLASQKWRYANADQEVNALHGTGPLMGLDPTVLWGGRHQAGRIDEFLKLRT